MSAPAIRSAWQLTEHAYERLGDRGIEAQQIWSLLDAPESTAPDPKRGGATLYAGYGITAIVDQESMTVITVGLEGSSGDDWERDARETRTPVRNLRPLPSVAEPQHWPPPASPRERVRAAPVEVRNALDGLHPAIRAAALREAGGDASRVRVVHYTKAEIIDS